MLCGLVPKLWLFHSKLGLYLTGLLGNCSWVLNLCQSNGCLHGLNGAQQQQLNSPKSWNAGWALEENSLLEDMLPKHKEQDIMQSCKCWIPALNLLNARTLMMY
jgi:hypothetical protein